MDYRTRQGLQREANETTRKEEAGPFGAKNECASAAALVNQFCESQGWDVGDDWDGKDLKPYPPADQKIIS